MLGAKNNERSEGSIKNDIENMREKLAVVGWVIAILSMIAGGVVGMFLCGYAFVGFMGWLGSDPFDWIEDMSISTYSDEQKRWDDCVASSRTIYDDFNDTIGVTYATDDKPSTEVQEFMKLCLEKNI